MRHKNRDKAGYVIMEDKRRKKLYRRRGVGKYVGGLVLCAACALFLAAGLNGRAARTGTVSVESARVRQEASTDAGIAGSLSSGDTVDIIDETESGGSTWYQISYTQDGEEVTGWLRSDLLTVAETEEPEETAEEPEEPAETETPAAGYTIQEPSEAPAANYLTQTTVQSGDTSYTAWQADADTALYLVWAAAPDGSTGWYWYDPAQNTFQQDLGQFSSQGLVSALQNELTSLKESSADDLSLRLYIIIGLGVLSVILLVLVIVFAVKSRNVEYEYYDDDDDVDDDDNDTEYDDDDGYGEEKKRKKGGLFSKRRKDLEEEDDEDDFDDFLAAVNRKRSEGSGFDSGEEEDEAEEGEEKVDLTLTANLPQIDMRGVEEGERKADGVAGEKKAQKAEEKKLQKTEEDDEDFDIEILDFDDLDL